MELGILRVVCSFSILYASKFNILQFGPKQDG